MNPQPNLSQQVFAFESVHNFAGENFLVAPSNKLAFDTATSFPWPSYALHIYGETGCGKTHIANIAQSLAQQNSVTLHAIENLHAGFDEVELLQKLNFAKERGENVLLTSSAPLIQLGFKLPDLTSRLAAIPSIAIEAPDSELFYMLLARQFSARQISVDDGVLNYLTNRLERSFSALVAAVEKIDKLSLQEKRSITIPLVKNVIE